MDQTLIVTYLPSGESSKTRRLLQYFLDHLNGPYQVLDLLDCPPQFLTADRMQAFLKRNYGKQCLTPEEQALVAGSDKYIRLLHEARNLVLAYPMHNFSMPAIIKCFFDAVIIKGETFDILDGEYVGLLTGHRGLALSTSGGIYETTSEWAHFEHCFSLQECLFKFMGYESGVVVPVQGCDELSQEEVEARFQVAFTHLLTIVHGWKEIA